MNDGGDFRTAPAIPGLLKMGEIESNRYTEVLEYKFPQMQKFSNTEVLKYRNTISLAAHSVSCGL